MILRGHILLHPIRLAVLDNNAPLTQFLRCPKHIVPGGEETDHFQGRVVGDLRGDCRKRTGSGHHWAVDHLLGSIQPLQFLGHCGQGLGRGILRTLLQHSGKGSICGLVGNPHQTEPRKGFHHVPLVGFHRQQGGIHAGDLLHRCLGKSKHQGVTLVPIVQSLDIVDFHFLLLSAAFSANKFIILVLDNILIHFGVDLGCC